MLVSSGLKRQLDLLNNRLRYKLEVYSLKFGFGTKSQDISTAAAQLDRLVFNLYFMEMTD